MKWFEKENKILSILVPIVKKIQSTFEYKLLDLRNNDGMDTEFINVAWMVNIVLYFPFVDWKTIQIKKEKKDEDINTDHMEKWNENDEMSKMQKMIKIMIIFYHHHLMNIFYCDN